MTLIFKMHRGAVSAEKIRRLLSPSADLREENLLLGGQAGKALTLIYLEGLCSSQEISASVVSPLTSAVRFPRELAPDAAFELAARGLVFGPAPKTRESSEETVSDILSGRCAVVFDCLGSALTFSLPSCERRAVDMPKEEKVVKGPKDGFVETLSVNSALVRRKLKTPKLRFIEKSVGGLSETKVYLAYVENLASEELIDGVSRRLESLDPEALLSAAQISESLAADFAASPFPRVITTERPDKFALNLTEGRVGLLADGLPLGFLFPATFSQFMKAPEDNSGHWLFSSFLTLIRYFAFILSSLAPALYVAVTTYHREMIPARLMQSIIDSKAFVPFPTALEVIGMLLAFDLLHEAGIRLPTPIGQTVSIIGGLIVGQSAVEAKVVSPVVVVIIAFSGIAGYTMPDQEMYSAIRIVRFSLTVAAALLGAYGIALVSALWIMHLAGLESFGTAYMSPFAGNGGRHISRALLRFPMTKKRDREPELTEANKK